MFIMPSFKKSLIVEQFQGNYLNWFFFTKKPFRKLSKQADKIILTTRQSVWCPALNKTPGIYMYQTSFEHSSQLKGSLMLWPKPHNLFTLLCLSLSKTELWVGLVNIRCFLWCTNFLVWAVPDKLQWFLKLSLFLLSFLLILKLIFLCLYNKWQGPFLVTHSVHYLGICSMKTIAQQLFCSLIVFRYSLHTFI